MVAHGTRQQVAARGKSWWGIIALLIIWAAFVYIWVVPVFRPAGRFLWGHYSLLAIYAGIPVGVAALCATIVLFTSPRYRRPVGIRLTVMSVSVLMTLFLVDAAYALGVMGAWRANYWLDLAHIPRQYSVSDPELGFVRKPFVSWTGTPNKGGGVVHYRTDENGFRNPPSIQRADIVFIGDSFTEAAQVDEGATFVNRVAEASGLSAVNLGRGSYGPQQELIVLRRYALSYQPRLIVWQLFDGNDLDDASNFLRWKTGMQKGKSLRERYLRNSLISTLLAPTVSPARDTTIATLRYHDGAELRASVRYRYRADKPAEMPDALNETTRALEEGYRLCHSKGIKLVVLFVPSMVQVLEPWLVFDSDAERANYIQGDESIEDFGFELGRYCQGIGLPYVNSLPALRGHASEDNRDIYLIEDPNQHLGLRGHETIAATLLEWMRSQQLLAVPE